MAGFDRPFAERGHMLPVEAFGLSYVQKVCHQVLTQTHKDNRTQTNTVMLCLATLSDKYSSQELIDSLIQENR